MPIVYSRTDGKSSRLMVAVPDISLALIDSSSISSSSFNRSSWTNYCVCREGKKNNYDINNYVTETILDNIDFY